MSHILSINKKLDILPIVLSCNRPECIGLCKIVNNELSKKNVFFVEKIVNCQDIESIEDAYISVSTNMYQYIKKVFVTTDISIIDKLIRISTENTTLPNVLSITNMIYHISNTKIDVSEYLDNLKAIIGSDIATMKKLNYLSNINIINRLGTQNTINLLNSSNDIIYDITLSSNVPDFCFSIHMLGYNFYSFLNIMHNISLENSNIIRGNISKIIVRVIICMVSDGNVNQEKNNKLINQFFKIFGKMVMKNNSTNNKFNIGEIKFDILYHKDNDIVSIRSTYDQSEKNNISGIKVSSSYYNLTDKNDQSNTQYFMSYINDTYQNNNSTIISVQSINWWYMLFKYQNKINYNELASDVLMVINTNHIAHLIAKSTKYDNNMHYELTFDLFKFIENASTDNGAKIESIGILNDYFAIGTKRIMLYYMLLYSYIGSYKPWLNIRKFLTNGVCDSDTYYKIPKYMYIDPVLQMTEHILHFSDIVNTIIYCIENTIIDIGHIPNTIFLKKYDTIDTSVPLICHTYI